MMPQKILNKVGKNPLRVDPTKTATIRRRYLAEMRRRFRALKTALRKLIVTEDAFGLREVSRDPKALVNTRWKGSTADKKLRGFQTWFKKNVQKNLLSGTWWNGYTTPAYRKGIERAYVDVRRGRLDSTDYDSSPAEFVATTLGQSAAKETLRVLEARTFSDLEGITDAMSAEINRALLDGLSQGLSPEQIADDLLESIEDIGETRAETLVRTEIVRAHAEGQLLTMERMGVEEVGVMVEWSTAGDSHVCEKCAPLEGVVIPIQTAHNLIPRHPNCRCAYIPAGVGEATDEQLFGDDAIAAFEDSIDAGDDKWSGASLLRDLGVINRGTTQNNCGTGAGGFQPGNTCASGGTGTTETTSESGGTTYGGDGRGDAAASGTRVRPTPRADGTTHLTHWSYHPSITVFDPSKHGTGVPGAESKRKKAEPHNWVDRTYYGMQVGQPNGYQKEPALGKQRYTTSIKLSELYDLAGDPDRLFKISISVTAYEKAIREAGYRGYWSDTDTSGLVAAVYDPLPVESHVTENAAGNCGTGAGGFQPGNTCAKGEGGESQTLSKREQEIIEHAQRIMFSETPVDDYDSKTWEYSAWNPVKHSHQVIEGDATSLYPFKTSKGQEYVVEVSPGADLFDTPGETPQQVVFADGEGRFGITGAGNALEVFSKVNPAIAAYMMVHQPDTLTFTAAEPSRQGLYDRLTRSVSKIVPEYAAIATQYSTKSEKIYMVMKRELLAEAETKLRSRGLEVETIANSTGDPEKSFYDFAWEYLEPKFDPNWMTVEGWSDLAYNAFCPTGEGGGVDPSCSPGKTESRASQKHPLQPREIEIEYGEYRRFLGANIHGYNFLGLSAGYRAHIKPTNRLDAIAKEHDRLYKEIRKEHGTRAAYAQWNHADAWMLQEMEKVPKDERTRAWHVAKIVWEIKRAYAPVAPGVSTPESRKLSLDIRKHLRSLFRRTPVANLADSEFFNLAGMVQALYQWDATTLRIVENVFCPTGEGGGVDPSCRKTAEPVKTKNFQKWFSGSKVTDKNGNPLIVYHGTKDHFEQFDDVHLGKSNDFGFAGAGHYFIDDPEWASGYAGDRGHSEHSGPNVMPVYLRITNPKIIRDFQEIPEIKEASDNWMMSETPEQSRERAYRIQSRLIAEGYDGIVIPGTSGNPTEFVVFKSSQVKSATGNSGLFSPDDSSIRNVFCATGEGGGVDPTCSPSGETAEKIPSAIGQKYLQFPDFTEEDFVGLEVSRKSAMLASRSQKIVAECEKIIGSAIQKKETIRLRSSWDDLEDDVKNEVEQEWISSHVEEYLEEPMNEWSEEVKSEIENDWKIAQTEFDNWTSEASEKTMTGWNDDWGTGLDFEMDDGTVSVDGEEEFKDWLNAADPAHPTRTRLEAFQEYLTDVLENKIQDALQDTPMHVTEQAYDDASAAFNELTDEEKTEIAGGDYAETRVDWPKEFKVTQNGHDYKLSGAIARIIQRDLTVQEVKDRLGFEMSPDVSRELADEFWGSWKNSSTSAKGLLLQYAAAQELGGFSQKFTEEQLKKMNEAARLLANDYIPESVIPILKEKFAGKTEDYITTIGLQLARSHVAATWSASQYILENAGLDELTVYRGLMLDSAKVKQERLNTVYGIGGHNYEKLPEIKILKNGAASTAIGEHGLSVANSWQGIANNKPSDPTRVVLRIKVPKEAVLSLPVFGQNVHGEHEAVITGTNWRAWDAFVGRAPSEKELSIGGK